MTDTNTDGAALLPVKAGTRLWCLHHIGPDDVHPAPDFATAQKWADWANHRFAEHSDLSRFVVAIWPWSAERHADGLAKSIEEWTLPEVGFDREWCINMAKQEAGYAIGAGELAIDPFTSSPLPATQEDAGRRQPWCETCGKSVAEIICPTCAKWWNDNAPPTPQRQEYDGEAVGEALKVAKDEIRQLGCDPDDIEAALARVNRAALAHPAQARDEMREALTEIEHAESVEIARRIARAALSSDKGEER